MKTRGRFMTAQCTAIVLSLVMAFTIFPSVASAATGDSADGTVPEAMTPDFVPGQLIVVTKQDTSKKQMRSIAKGVDGQVDTISDLDANSKMALIEVEEGSELSVAAELECDDRVLFVQPNYIYEFEDDEYLEEEEFEEDAEDTDADAEDPNSDAEEPEEKPTYPDDPLYKEQQKVYLAPVDDGGKAGTANAKGAWDQLANLNLQGNKRPLVAVIDTGALLTHEDLKDVIIKDMCVTINDGEVLNDFKYGDGAQDDDGHGTMVTGILAAETNNEAGIAGVTENRADVFVIDDSLPNGSTLSSDIAIGVNYAVGEGAKLINMSLGFFNRDYVVETAIENAWNEGTLCICSAGNSDTAHMHYPSDSPYAIAVMANRKGGDPYSGTCYGVEKDISAPGCYLTAPTNTGNGDYIINDSVPNVDVTGTSFAAPIVTGAAALLLAANPNLTPRQIKNLIYTSTGKESFSATKEGQGFGMINIDTAMRNLLAKKTTPKKIVINKPKVELIKGTKTSIEYAVYPGNTKTTKVTFKSSNKKVATVNKDGIITAKAPGTTKIKVTCDKVSTKCVVTVKEQPYENIDRNPYFTDRTFALDEPIAYDEERDEDGTITNILGYNYHQYRIKLEEDETIRVIMSPVIKIRHGRRTAFYPYLRILDQNGEIVAYDISNDIETYAMITYKAVQAGTYQIQAIQVCDKKNVETDYEFQLVSDKGFCEPEIKYVTDDEVCFSWPAADGTDEYIVKKYWEKDLADWEYEYTSIMPEHTDSDNYYSDMVNYYTVAARVKTKAGVFLTGESLLVVKMQNTMSAEGKTYKVKRKTLKKKSVKLSRDKVMTVENAEGTVTYKKISGKKKITINKKTGKVKVKKGLKKGTYPVKVDVTAEGNDDYFPITKTVTFTIRVK